jgi:hypothetical protein
MITKKIIEKYNIPIRTFDIYEENDFLKEIQLGLLKKENLIYSEENNFYFMREIASYASGLSTGLLGAIFLDAQQPWLVNTALFSAATGLSQTISMLVHNCLKFVFKISVPQILENNFTSVCSAKQFAIVKDNFNEKIASYQYDQSSGSFLVNFYQEEGINNADSQFWTPENTNPIIIDPFTMITEKIIAKNSHEHLLKKISVYKIPIRPFDIYEENDLLKGIQLALLKKENLIYSKENDNYLMREILSYIAGLYVLSTALRNNEIANHEQALSLYTSAFCVGTGFSKTLNMLVHNCLKFVFKISPPQILENKFTSVFSEKQFAIVKDNSNEKIASYQYDQSSGSFLVNFYQEEGINNADSQCWIPENTNPIIIAPFTNLNTKSFFNIEDVLNGKRIAVYANDLLNHHELNGYQIVNFNDDGFADL